VHGFDEDEHFMPFEHATGRYPVLQGQVLPLPQLEWAGQIVEPQFTGLEPHCDGTPIAHG
jgi:hypothetical protein